MRDSGLEKSEDGQNRTLYSLRHTYATLELVEKRTDIHTLAKQMGNSAAMIERHYSKLTATMAAEMLA
jgi:integrase